MPLSATAHAWVQVVLAKAHNAAELDAVVNQHMVAFASRGFRALGLAWVEGHGVPGEETQWEMLALLPMFDPPRHDTKDTIEHCQKLVGPGAWVRDGGGPGRPNADGCGGFSSGVGWHNGCQKLVVMGHTPLVSLTKEQLPEFLLLWHWCAGSPN